MRAGAVNRRVQLPMFAIAVVAAMAVMAAAARPAAASPAEELNVARDAFRRRDWDASLPILSSLLYPRPRLASLEDLFEAHLLLGMCAFESGDRATAAREFDEAIYLENERQLETVLFSDGAVALYEERRVAIRERLKLEEEKRALALEREKYRQMLAAMVVVEKRNYWINYIPFGAGQFQNKDTGKGIALATTQGITAAVSAGIFMYIAGTYGLFNGRVDPDDAAGVLRLQQIEIVSGAAFFALYAAGVVDSLIHYKPSVVRRPDESALPPELRRTDPPRRAPDGSPETSPPAGFEPERSPATTFRLIPTPLPGGAGVSLSWEF